MRNSARALIEAVESRQLLSGTPGPWTPPTLGPKAQADLQAIHADLAQIKTDSQAAEPTLAKDRAALSAAIKAAYNSDAVKALEQKLDTDRKAAQPNLISDLQAIRNVYESDLPAIFKDFKAIVAAGSDATKRAAAKAQLATDQKKLSTDLAAAQAKLKTDQALVIGDEKAIRAAIDNDPAVVAAKATLSADEAKLKADYTKLVADQKQLAIDIKNKA